MRKLYVHNSLSRQREAFDPITEGYVGMYVCGPTVYSDVHLGNCRTFTSFDVIFRFLKHLGYKVRYVRNITDVGHLEGDVDVGGEDKIAKKARLEQLEPMEVVQKYSNGFQQMMETFNILPPSIEPRATGHILEQIDMIKKIIANGFAYEINGSVYFDTPKFIAEEDAYGKLSGRVVDDLLQETRDNLKRQDEKRDPSDFALWIKADATHLMRWESPWSTGFPGWHLECSAMSTKYLGPHFDIHGGGTDLKFPHHENEIAQNMGACKCTPAKYWLHANMLLLNGKKMSKSDGNSVMPQQLFSGESEHLSKGFAPMVVRFFMLQAHYRSTLDLTNDALLAAEKGYQRLMEAYKSLQRLDTKAEATTELDQEISTLIEGAYQDMCDDFNTAKALGKLFELATKINALHNGQLKLEDLSSKTLAALKEAYHTFLFDIFGLESSVASAKGEEELIDGLMNLIIDLRKGARENKDWGMADKIRDTLSALAVQVKDGKDGTTWSKK
ncbi:MAG: cysteine--tRNA ligase [Saprospiraceae bacterium]|nr:cysteine--tRNA ligase [Saprospiraceae bacterium]